jgi:cell pole-organizing protein PopZ
MGAADKVVDPDVEAALSAIRLAISRENSAARPAPKGGAAVSSRDSGGGNRPDWRGLRAPPRASTSPEEIVELRNKIAGHLDRMTAPRPPLPEPRPARANGGFAGILSGETRLQEPPHQPSFEPERPASRPAEHYREPAQRSYREPAPPPRADYRDVAEARWHEEPAHHAPPQVPVPADYAEPESPLLSHDAATATQAAFNQLAETLMARALGERSVEEVTRELLRTMLKNWLDENLPPLVERLVREEIERVARRGPQR